MPLVVAWAFLDCLQYRTEEGIYKIVYRTDPQGNGFTMIGEPRRTVDGPLMKVIQYAGDDAVQKITHVLVVPERQTFESRQPDPNGGEGFVEFTVYLGSYERGGNAYQVLGIADSQS